MSTAAVDAVEVPKKASGKFSKKLVLILAIVALLAAIGGGAAFYLLKKRAAAAAAAAAEEEDGGEVADHAPAKKDHKSPPNFLPLEPFVVNLTDRDPERFAQIGVTLQIDDPKVAEELKLYMPAIRNGVLMVMAHKSSAELLEREGKEKLAAEIMREAVRPLGIDLPDPDTVEPVAAEGAKPAKKKKKAEPEHNPVEHVHFSSFIIQ